VIERAAILTAFEQIGGAQRCLEMARDYALTRYAFGRVIGSYQAIKHKLVDIYAKNRMAIAHAYYGAWALSTGSADLAIAAAAARVTASDAFNFAAQENIQAHGGIGFTWEHPCHLFYRRARLLSLELGSPHEWREVIAANLHDKNAA
jgi:alkylation response protein AidB-like acyl-CoA dehydrogenase